MNFFLEISRERQNCFSFSPKPSSVFVILDYNIARKDKTKLEEMEGGKRKKATTTTTTTTTTLVFFSLTPAMSLTVVLVLLPLLDSLLGYVIK